jgi:hypothetical protein
MEGRRTKKKRERVNGDDRGAGEEKKREMEGRRSRQGGRNMREEEISVNPLQHDVIFFGAFFGLYVRCQFISGWQKTPSFCHDRT